MQIQIIRKPVKNFRLLVRKNGEVVFTVPTNATEKKINEILTQKKGWIEKKYAEVTAILQAKSNITGILFKGKEYKFLYDAKLYKRVIIDADAISSGIDFNDEKKLDKWYKEQSYAYALETVKKYSQIIGVFPTAVLLYKAKTKWGQCKSNGEIKLHVYLIKAPREIFDYVIIHELCHLKVMAHNKTFYRHVEKYCPDYKACEKWLKRYGELLK